MIHQNATNQMKNLSKIHISGWSIINWNPVGTHPHVLQRFFVFFEETTTLPSVTAGGCLFVWGGSGVSRSWDLFVVGVVWMAFHNDPHFLKYSTMTIPHSPPCSSPMKHAIYICKVQVLFRATLNGETLLSFTHNATGFSHVCVVLEQRCQC